MLLPPHLPRRLALPALLLLASFAPAQAPLHQRIDQAITASPVAPPADDAEFLRRAYLDLTGTVPTAAEARAFLQDTAPAKRQALIDRLLASPEHARHLATVFDVMLMERLPAKNVPEAQWREYLRASFAANKPWDVLVREILTSDGADVKQRGPARFLLDRGGEPNMLTRDVSRLLLGMNLQCAQCHDHPRVEEYKQDHYYGLYAFLNRTTLVRDKALNVAVLSEKADGEVTFQSVFDPAKVTKSTGPRLPGGPPLKEPKAEKGKEYVVAPAPNARSVPKFSRRALLGPQLARADNRPFTRNIANRLWALLMGRGLVHPLDMDHPANPPSHPALLDLLTDDLAAHQFDVRYFLRELALSQTYQRSSELPAGAAEPEPAGYTVALLKPLTPEQLAAALMQSTGLADAERQALGKNATEAALYGRLAGNVAPFVRTFAGPAGKAEEFDARLDQALFLANGPVVRGWLAPRPGNLTDRLGKLSGPDAVSEELYLSVFTRLPAAEERKEAADFLASRAQDRPAALQDLAWALLASAEFRFNH
jgi:Protein of unknown function (DUF1549)/Protein of unknown function (DUF1553)